MMRKRDTGSKPPELIEKEIDFAEHRKGVKAKPRWHMSGVSKGLPRNFRPALPDEIEDAFWESRRQVIDPED